MLTARVAVAWVAWAAWICKPRCFARGAAGRSTARCDCENAPPGGAFSLAGQLLLLCQDVIEAGSARCQRAITAEFTAVNESFGLIRSLTAGNAANAPWRVLTK